MAFKPIQKLSVNRTLSTGQVVWVGTLAQNSQGIFFQYDEAYLSILSVGLVRRKCAGRQVNIGS
jgi:hypothetical protein